MRVARDPGRALWRQAPCALCMAVFIALAGAAEGDATSEPDGEKLLRYGERPLRGDDFRAPVPDDRPDTTPRIEAYSHTVVRYEYQARSRRRGSRYEAEAVDIKIYAAFDGEKSWNAQPENAALLDHHEGHFDLAEITARTIERELASRRRDRRALVGKGTTEAAAAADLEMQLAKLVTGHTTALQREHDYFDQITRYGTLPDVEARERQKQRDTLRRTMRTP